MMEVEMQGEQCYGALLACCCLLKRDSRGTGGLREISGYHGHQSGIASLRYLEDLLRLTANQGTPSTPKASAHAEEGSGTAVIRNAWYSPL